MFNLDSQPFIMLVIFALFFLRLWVSEIKVDGFLVMTTKLMSVPSSIKTKRCWSYEEF